MRLALGLALCLGLLVSHPAASQTPIPVGVAPAELKPITKASDFVGRVEAIERVDVRARVTGFLEKIEFKEGDMVKEGAVLYRIEPESFQAAVQQARGALLQAQANFTNASAQRARTEELVKTAAASRATLDERVAAEKSAQGDVVTADAALKTATINLGYTEITSPITGEVGRSKVTKGNVVGPDSGVLTTIVSRDPMYVVSPVSQREFLGIERTAEKKTAGDQLTVRVRFSDGSVYPETGKINFIDVSVNRSTDSVTIRATLPNAKGQLIDGQLVRVAVEAAKPEEKIVVPQSALILDQQGVYVFVVENGKAAIRRITTGGECGANMVVDSGLKPGEPVVVQGMEALRPGTPVIGSPVSAPATAR